MKANGNERSNRLQIRAGLALPLVLLLTSVLLVLAVTFLRVNSDDLSRTALQMTRVQASYLVKGGINLALLKAKLLPEPLFVAVSFRVGRNPYFPHGRIQAYDNLGSSIGFQDCTQPGFDPADPNTLITGGPAFFTGIPGAPPRPQNRTNTDLIPGAPNNNAVNGDYDGDGVAELRVAEYLAQFRSDLCDANVIANFGLGANRLSPQNNIRIDRTVADQALGVPDPQVYGTGSFLVSDIATYGTRGSQNATDEVLRIVVRARLTTNYSGIPRTETVEEFTFHKINRNL